jgi:CRISPR-associated protein Cas6
MLAVVFAMIKEMKIDLRLQIFGSTLNVDHGYALFSAVSKELPQFHEAGDVGMGLIRGKYIGQGQLSISPSSSLSFRLPISQVAEYINLAGKSLDIDGQLLRVGVPSSHSLIPSPALYAHLVTSRNAQDQNRFAAEMARQLATMDCKGELTIGKRRTFKVHGKQVVGYSVLVSELTADESIALQENGLGGRPKMGCGFFLPWQG